MQTTDSKAVCGGREPVTLAECPVGLFVSESGILGLKTEYHGVGGATDCYIVETGEFFWGSGNSTPGGQAAQKVRPIPYEVAAALASTAGAGAGDWRPITTMPDDLDRKAWPIQIWAPNHVRPVSAVDWREDATDRGAAMWKPMSAPPGQSPAVPASPRSGAGEGGKVRSRLEAEGWSQASVVSGYWDKSRPDNAFVCVVNRDLRLLDEATHKLASPPAPAEHGVEIRERVEAILRDQIVLRTFHGGYSFMEGFEQAAEAVISALSQADAAGRSERAVEIRELSERATVGEEGRDSLPENWPEVLIRRGVWGRGGEYTKARDTEGTSDLLVQTATMLSADRERRRAGGFQARVIAQMHRICEGDPTDLAERRDRHAEEDAELLQSLGLTREAHHRIVDYVHDRPVGEPDQEMGGTMHTLAGLAAMAGLDMMACGEREFARVDSPEVTAKIRRKRSNRHGRGPLPGNDADLNTALAPAQSPSTSDREG